MSQNTVALLIIHFIVLCFVFKTANPSLSLHFDRIKQTVSFYPIVSSIKKDNSEWDDKQKSPPFF